MSKSNCEVSVVMGSGSDFTLVEKTLKTLEYFGVKADVHVISAHRTPLKAAEFASSAEENGTKIIIAAAGKAAHLAGVIAGHTLLPVIGLPVKSSFCDGLDSLLSVVQMPKGIPVATVAVDGAENAAVLAVQILSLSDRSLRRKLSEFKQKMISDTEKADAEIKGRLV